MGKYLPYFMYYYILSDYNVFKFTCFSKMIEDNLTEDIHIIC